MKPWIKWVAIGTAGYAALAIMVYCLFNQPQGTSYPSAGTPASSTSFPQSRAAVPLAPTARGWSYQDEDTPQVMIPTLQLQQGDVREALRALFKNVNISYSIAPDVQGPVTVNLTNVTFATALQAVLSQVGASYRVQEGVYHIFREP